MYTPDNEMNNNPLLKSGEEMTLLAMPLAPEILPIAQPVVKKNTFDNTFSKAQVMGELTTNGFKSNDYVGKGDFQDYYKISLKETQNNLSIRLDNLDGEVTVHLYDGKRKQIDSYLMTPEDNQVLTYDSLENGDYYVRIEAESMKTRINYDLSITNSIDGSTIVADAYNNKDVSADDTLKTANKLGVLNTPTYVIAGNIAYSSGNEAVKNDPTDVFSFELESGKEVSFSINSMLNADALQLFDRYGNEINLKISEDHKTATVDVAWLDAGQYYLQINENMMHPMVYPYSASYDYQIKVNLADPNYNYNIAAVQENLNQNADDSFIDATKLDLTTSDYGYLSFGGTLNNQKSSTQPIDIKDVFKIDLKADQRLSFNLNGLYNDALKLYNADFQEVTNINRNNNVDPIVYDTAMPPMIYSYLNTGNLKAGTYYIQIGNDYLDNTAIINYQVGLSTSPATKYTDNQENPSADNSIKSAQAITFENDYSYVTGTLNGQKGNEDTQDFYAITLDKSTVLNFSSSAVSLKGLHLFDSKGNTLALNDISSEDWNYLPNAEVDSISAGKLASTSIAPYYMDRVQSKQLDAGTYYLEVDNISVNNNYYNTSDFIDYSISIEKHNPLIYADNYTNVNVDDTLQTANAVTFDASNNTKFQGTLSYSRGYPNSQNDTTDYYKISLNHTSGLSIKVDGVESIESVKLFDSKGQEINLKESVSYLYPMPYMRVDDSNNSQTNSLTFENVDLEIGDYYLQILDTKNHGVVSPYTNSTIYTVDINRFDIPEIKDNIVNPNTDDEIKGANLINLVPQDITDSSGITKPSDTYSTGEFRGSLYYTDGSDGKQADLSDFYKIDLKHTNNLYINVSNVNFNSLHLYASDGTEIQLNEQMIMYAKAEGTINNIAPMAMKTEMPLNQSMSSVDNPSEELSIVDSNMDAKIMPIMAPWYPNNDAHAYINKLAEGSYYLEIRYDQSVPKNKGYTENISYQANLSTTQIPDVVYQDNRKNVLADNEIAGANLITLSKQTVNINGTVSYVAGYENQGLASDPTDYYKIDLKANSDLSLSFIDAKNGVDIKEVHIYDANGKDITADITVKPEYDYGFDSLQTTVLDKGIYYIEVREFGMHTKQYPYKSITDYELQVSLGNAQAVEHVYLDDNRYSSNVDNNIAGANQLVNLQAGDNQIHGLLQEANGYKYQESDHKDIYKLNISKGTTLIASFDELDNAGLSLNNLHLLNEKGEDITAKVSVQSLLPLNEIHTQALDAGTYYLEVEDNNSYYKPSNLSYYERPYTIDLTLNDYIKPVDQAIVNVQYQAMAIDSPLEIAQMTTPINYSTKLLETSSIVSNNALGLVA